MPPLLARLFVFAVAALSFAMLQSDGCGYEPPPEKGLGEPCTRSSECQSSLICSGGVCMQPTFDAGSPRDAGNPPRPDAGFDASLPPDAAMDASVDAAADAGDGSVPDAAFVDGAVDGAPSDAAGDAAGSSDGGGA